MKRLDPIRSETPKDWINTVLLRTLLAIQTEQDTKRIEALELAKRYAVLCK